MDTLYRSTTHQANFGAPDVKATSISFSSEYVRGTEPDFLIGATLAIELRL